MIKITLPDGTVKEFQAGVTALDVATSISEGLARNVLSAKVNDEVIDATRPIETDSTVQLLTWRDEEGKSTMWHSSAHLMAEALQELYPEVIFTIGPPIDNGFYYDLDLQGETISENDFKNIENKMLELARQKNTFDRSEVTKAEALEAYKDNPYKTELIENLEDGTITFYKQGNFTDLCRGPHIPHTRIHQSSQVDERCWCLLAR